MTELPEEIATPLAPENFDVLDFVAGKGTPVGKVTIYTDDEAGHELAEWAQKEADNADRAEAEGFGIADEVEWIDPDVLDELRARVEASALTFKLRGLTPAEKKAIRNSLIAKHNFKEDSTEPQEEYFEEYSYTLIAKSIASVTRADGAIDDKKWTVERVAALRAKVNETEFARLDGEVYDINFKTDIYDRAVSADFLSKR